MPGISLLLPDPPSTLPNIYPATSPASTRSLSNCSLDLLHRSCTMQTSSTATTRTCSLPRAHNSLSHRQRLLQKQRNCFWGPRRSQRPQLGLWPSSRSSLLDSLETLRSVFSRPALSPWQASHSLDYCLFLLIARGWWDGKDLSRRCVGGIET